MKKIVKISKLVLSKDFKEHLGPGYDLSYKKGQVLETRRSSKSYYDLDLEDHQVILGFGIDSAIPREYLTTKWFEETTTVTLKELNLTE